MDRRPEGKSLHKDLPIKLFLSSFLPLPFSPPSFRKLGACQDALCDARGLSRLFSLGFLYGDGKFLFGRVKFARAILENFLQVFFRAKLRRAIFIRVGFVDDGPVVRRYCSFYMRALLGSLNLRVDLAALTSRQAVYIRPSGTWRLGFWQI